MFGNTPTKEELDKMTQERDALLVSLNNEKANVAGLKSQVKGLETEYSEITSTIEKLENQATLKKEELEKLENQADVEQGELIDIQKTKKETELALQHVKDELEKANAGVEETIRTLQDTLEKEKVRAGEKILEFEKAIIERQNELVELDDEFTKADKEVDKKQGELNTLLAEIEDGENVLKDSQSGVQDTQAEYESLVKKIDELNTDYGNRQAELVEKEEDIKSRLQTLMDDVNEEAGELARVREEKESITDEIEQSRKAFVKLAQKEERIREFCDDKGIDHSKL